MNGLPYYKAFPRDFVEGTIGMSFEMKGAYRIVLDLIYMQNGTLPDDARYISGHLGCSVKKWNSLRIALIEAGKIYVSGEFLRNDRADKELETLGKYQDQQRQNRARPNKNNDIQSPPSHHTEPDTDKEIPEAKASGGNEPPADFAKELFDRAVAFLVRHHVSDQSARSFVAMLRKDGHTDSQIFDAFSRCHKAGAVEPRSWIRKALGQRPVTKADTDNVLRLAIQSYADDEQATRRIAQ